MTTLQNLIDYCEADLADSGNSTWSAADVEQWCRDAIRDYTIHFPRRGTADIETTAGDQEYDLSAGVLRVLSVIYPSTSDPPIYLQRRPHVHPDFWGEDGYYDIIEHEDAGDVNEIWISFNPENNKYLRLTYEYEHKHDTTNLTTATALTVPDRHLAILRLYVRWQAVLQRAASEEASPTSNSSLLMSQLASNARRLKVQYIDVLAKALVAERGGSAVVSWRDQENETTRIY